MSNVDPNERHPDYCPICGKLHKGRFHSMTTAAPEKMSDRELALSIQGAAKFLRYHEFLDHAAELDEAARRLARGVGDDAVREALQAMYDAFKMVHTDRAEALNAYALAKRALSAPPAASADAEMVTQIRGFADHLEAAGRDMDAEFLRSVASRLSALPKGQEHEG